jgi:hypothetical protein
MTSQTVLGRLIGTIVVRYFQLTGNSWISSTSLIQQLSTASPESLLLELVGGFTNMFWIA